MRVPDESPTRGELINARARAGARWAEAKDLLAHLPKKTPVYEMALKKLQDAEDVYAAARKAEEEFQ
jgi:hypothetical protein